MNLLADESVDRQIVERPRQEGYIVGYIGGTLTIFSKRKLPATADNRVLEVSTQRLCPSQALCYRK